MERRSHKKKPPISLPVFDLRSTDAPERTEVAVDAVADPMPNEEQMGAQRMPALRRDGSLATTGSGEWFVPGQPKVIVLRATKKDPLGWMKSHSRLDEAQYLAGRRWQDLYERSQLGLVQAVDTTKEPVDGGQMPEVLTDRQRLAIHALAAAESAVVGSVRPRGAGIERVQLLRAVLGDGLFLREVAEMRGMAAKKDQIALGAELRNGLDVLAEQFGFSFSSVKTLERRERIGYGRGHNQKMRSESAGGDGGCTRVARQTRRPSLIPAHSRDLAEWSSQVARRPHKPQAARSNRVSATNDGASS